MTTMLIEQSCLCLDGLCEPCNAVVARLTAMTQPPDQRPATIAEMLLAIEPEMRELTRLRADVIELRIRTAPPTPTLAELLEGGPIEVRCDDDGTWSSSIALGAGAGYTGVSGCPTDVRAYQLSVQHLATLLGEAWMEAD